MTELIGLLTLFLGVPLNAVVTVMLWRQSRRNPEFQVLRERAITATAVLLTTLVFGLVFVNNDQADPPLALVATKYITRITLVVVWSVPASYLLWLWRKNRQRPGKD